MLSTLPVVLGILQNEWHYDPPRVKALIARSIDPEKYRKKLITHSLFGGCKSGRMLRQSLGDKWCNHIQWENASREIGDVASSVFPHCPVHLRTIITQINPQIVITFGKVAAEGIDELLSMIPEQDYGFEVIRAPHPTARFMPDLASKLHQVRKQLDLMHTILSHEPNNWNS